MSHVLVIGCGNTLRGDDAAGVRAAEVLAFRCPEVECLCVHQLTPELAEQLGGYRMVIFLDADLHAARAIARAITPEQPGAQPQTHFLSPEALLALSLELYKCVPPSAYVIGIPASDFEFSEELSATARKGVADSVHLAEGLIARA